MAKIPGTRITNPIVPGDTQDTYPTHIDIYGAGGYITIETFQDFLSFKQDRQKIGQLFFVQDLKQYLRITAVGTPPSYVTLNSELNPIGQIYTNDDYSSFRVFNLSAGTVGMQNVYIGEKIGSSFQSEAMSLSIVTPGNNYAGNNSYDDEGEYTDTARLKKIDDNGDIIFLENSVTDIVVEGVSTLSGKIIEIYYENPAFSGPGDSRYRQLDFLESPRGLDQPAGTRYTVQSFTFNNQQYLSGTGAIFVVDKVRSPDTNNTFIGHDIADNTTTANYNIVMGSGSVKSANLLNSTVLGSNVAVSAAKIDSCILIGDNVARISSNLKDVIYIGRSAGENNLQSESNIYIGASAGYTGKISNRNVFIGQNAGYLANTTLDALSVINEGTLYPPTSSWNNIQLYVYSSPSQLQRSIIPPTVNLTSNAFSGLNIASIIDGGNGIELGTKYSVYSSLLGLPSTYNLKTSNDSYIVNFRPNGVTGSSISPTIARGTLPGTAFTQTGNTVTVTLPDTQTYTSLLKTDICRSLCFYSFDTPSISRNIYVPVYIINNNNNNPISNLTRISDYSFTYQSNHTVTSPITGTGDVMFICDLPQDGLRDSLTVGFPFRVNREYTEPYIVINPVYDEQTKTLTSEILELRQTATYALTSQFYATLSAIHPAPGSYGVLFEVLSTYNANTYNPVLTTSTPISSFGYNDNTSYTDRLGKIYINGVATSLWGSVNRVGLNVFRNDLFRNSLSLLRLPLNYTTGISAIATYGNVTVIVPFENTCDVGTLEKPSKTGINDLNRNVHEMVETFSAPIRDPFSYIIDAEAATGIMGGSFDVGYALYTLSPDTVRDTTWPIFTKKFAKVYNIRQGYWSNVGFRLACYIDTLTPETSTFYTTEEIDNPNNSGDINAVLLNRTLSSNTIHENSSEEQTRNEIIYNPGSVAYTYRFGKNLVTNTQYVSFLNSISASSNTSNFPYSLVNLPSRNQRGLLYIASDNTVSQSKALRETTITSPSLYRYTDPVTSVQRLKVNATREYSEITGVTNDSVFSKRDGIIRTLTSDLTLYNFTVRPGFENKPVNFVCWHDAARFCNWMHNNMPVGPMDASTTENGAYDLHLGGIYAAPGSIKADSLNTQRTSNAKWFLPNPNEWYKAAYYSGSAGGFICEATSINNSENNVFLGSDAGSRTTSSDSSIVIGHSAQNLIYNNSIVLGNEAVALHHNSLVLGSATTPVTGYVFGPLSARELKSNLGTFDVIKTGVLSADNIYGNITVNPVFEVLSATDYVISNKGLQVNNTATLTSFKITNDLNTTTSSFTGSNFFIKVVINENITKYLRLYDIE